MKQFVMILLMAAAMLSHLRAQETYSLVYSNPDDLNYGYVSFNYLGIDAGFKNTSGAMMVFGAEAFYPVTRRIGVEGMFALPIYRFDNSVGASVYEVGGEYALIARNKTGKTSFLLSLSWSDDAVTSTRTTTYKFVEFQTQFRRDISVRGGFYRHQSAYQYYYTEHSYDVVDMQQTGIYGGIGWETGNFAHIRNTSNKRTRAYGGLSKLFADVMVLPTEVQSKSYNESKKATLGWRLGWKFHITPYKKDKTILKERAGFFANSFYRIEFGQRPHEGIFVTGTFGYAPIKF